MRQIAYKFKIKYDPPDVIASIIIREGELYNDGLCGRRAARGVETARS